MSLATLKTKLLKNSTIADTAIITKSKIFGQKDIIKTDVPMINVACSGDPDGGLLSGILQIVGESKHFKTSFMLLLASAFLQKYEDGLILFYDSEFGSTESYITSFDIDPERIIHTPIFNIEQLTHDITVQLEGLDREDHIIIIIDSIGNLASIKEIKDALEGSDKADMTRAKKLKALGRIITPHLTMKDIPLILVNHVYKEIGPMYPKNIVGGGQGMYLSSDNIWMIGRRQDRDKKTKEINGYEFVINIEKSRFVKEKSEIPITVSFAGGINRWSGLLDLAVEAGYVVSPVQGKYARAHNETEITQPLKRDVVETNSPFWRDIFENTDFSLWLKNKYQLPETLMLVKESE